MKETPLLALTVPRAVIPDIGLTPADPANLEA